MTGPFTKMSYRDGGEEKPLLEKPRPPLSDGAYRRLKGLFDANNRLAAIFDTRLGPMPGDLRRRD